MSIEPEVFVEQSREAVDFYKAAFGARELHRVGGEDIVAQLEVGDARFWVHGGELRVRLLLVVEDPQAVFAQAVAAGATELSPVAEEHGWLVGRLEDPFGHLWEIGKPL